MTARQPSNEPADLAALSDEELLAHIRRLEEGDRGGVFAVIREQTRPGVARARRRARLRAWARRVWELRRVAFVLACLALMVTGFWLIWGAEGLLAALTASITSLVAYAFLFRPEREP